MRDFIVTVSFIGALVSVIIAKSTCIDAPLESVAFAGVAVVLGIITSRLGEGAKRKGRPPPDDAASQQNDRK